MTDVKVGQIWADNDWRSKGRQVRVQGIEGSSAICVVVMNATEVQEYVDRKKQRPAWAQNAYQDVRGKSVKIKLSRFKPTSTGYRLVQDVDV